MAAPELPRDVVWYAVAGISYIVAGLYEKMLLTWLIGPSWLVGVVWLGPIVTRSITGPITGRIAAWRLR